MNKPKVTVLDICICALMIALHIVLESFGTIRIGNELKITFSTLPIVLAGMLCGPAEGLAVGLVGTFLSQLLTYGITVTTPIWILPGMLQGLASGLIYAAFHRKARLLPIAVNVFSSDLVLVIFNLLASYLDGVVIFKYWTIEALAVLIPVRLLVWVILSVIYTMAALPICRILQKKCPADIRSANKGKTYQM